MFSSSFYLLNCLICILIIISAIIANVESTNLNENDDSLILAETDNRPINSNNANSSTNTTSSVTFNSCPPRCSCLGEYIECKKLNLKHVPPLPQWVRSLELPGNKYDDSIENLLGNLTTLKILNLKKNQLHRMPLFVGLVSLEKLNLAHNRIQSLSREAIEYLPKLKELDLMKNRIKIIPADVFRIRNRLNVLNMNGNQIETIEENGFDNFGHLTELYLNHNHLKDLPHDVFKSLNVLRKLDLSNNRLNVSWAIFKGLEQLRILKLRSNGIEHLTDGVFQALKSITVIELDSNRITNLSRGGFFNLITLTSLSLANNTIRHFESDTWEFVQQLVSLDLSLNNLSEIGHNDFKCLTKLKKLNLQYNRIKYIDDSGFGCFSNLENLDLSGNHLSWTIEGMSGPFANLKKLQTLDLKYNDVRSISKKAFLGLGSVEYLNLNGNNITTIQFNAFEPLKRLNRLTINSTHFLCDCNLRWLHDWLTSHLEQQTIPEPMIICDYPDELRGRHLLSLREDKDFMCNESPKPRLMKEPSNQLAIKGTSIELECSATSSASEPMTFQWRRDNIDLAANQSETRTQHLNSNTVTSSFLRLNDVNREQNGKYQCVVSNSFGSAYSQRFKITVASYPLFRRTPTNVTLSAGKTAQLDCSAFGEPMPQIAWQKDGGNDFPAAVERRMHMTADNAFLISNAKPSDMGVYTCTAENPAGIIKANATLIVNETPSFYEAKENDMEIVLGRPFVLDCFVGGSPKPELHWFKDGQLLQSNADRLYFAADRQLLIVKDSIADDIGSYTCEIRNTLGSAMRQHIVKIAKPVTKALMNGDEMTGIIVITIFCCTIATSIIWVVILYHTKKGNECNTGNENFVTSNAIGLGRQINQSMNLRSRFLLQQEQQAAAGGTGRLNEDCDANGDITLGFYHITNGTLQPSNDNDDCSSSKDSGTGDSAKRSRSIDDINLNDSYSNCGNNPGDSYELNTYVQKRQQQTMPLIQSPSNGQRKASMPTTMSAADKNFTDVTSINNNNKTISNQSRHTHDKDFLISSGKIAAINRMNAPEEQAVPLIDNDKMNPYRIANSRSNINPNSSSIASLSKFSGNNNSVTSNGDVEISIST